MSADIRCPAVENDELLHRYVAGTLEEDRVAALEIHLLECEACQQAVREGSALAAGLSAWDRSRRPRLWWVIPGAAAAAVLGVLLLGRASGPLQELGRIDRAPAFEGLPVRAEPDSVTAFVDRAMAAYVAGNYARAGELLEAAADMDSTPGVHFFLGISRLMTDSPSGARDALARALEPPGNPYAAEARFYLAKAWLLLGRTDSALSHLAAISPDAGRLHDHAVALADSVRQAGD